MRICLQNYFPPKKSVKNYLIRSQVYILVAILSSLSVSAQTVNSWITTSDQSKLLEQQATVNFITDPSTNPSTITVNTDTYYQEVDGFGFCLTDGSAQVISGMNSTEQDALLNELFNTSTGLGISVLRISIGASDLSPYSYSYDDIASGTDENMDQFSLAGPTLTYTVPILNKILAINPDIKIFGSPWSAPKWMKTNNEWVGGSINPSYYSAYSRYFVKYIQAMQGQGIPIWAVTIQNEPENPNNEPSMVMTSSNEIDFVNNYLGPAFQNAGIATKIIAFDHNCDHPNYPIDVLNKSSYVDGAAFHLYAGSISALSTVYNATGKNVYFTEQWTGSNETFASNLSWHMQNVMIGSMNNWARIAMEWNLANDQNYAPHTPGGCTQCKGAITVSSSTTFSRNPSYYIVGQMTKVVKPGAFRIPSTSSDNNLSNTAFLNPDGSIALVVYNSSASAISFKLDYNGQAISYSAPANAAISLLWSNSSIAAFPTVSITSPSNDSFVEINNVVAITADASVSGGTIDSVEFYVGSSLIAKSTSSPYTVNWTPSTSGSYSLKAIAYDHNGQYATSSIVNATAFSYSAIPGKIESENYTDMLGLQTENCSDVGGTQDVGYTDAGDWLEYMVDVASTGYYKVEYRIAGTSQGSLEIVDQSDVNLGSITVPSTGGWQTWSSIIDTIHLSAGKQSVKIKVDQSGWNINYMNFTYQGSVLGILKSDVDAGIVVYPNPHSKTFNVQLSFASNENVTLSLINSLGEIVRTFESKVGSSKDFMINTEDLPTGIYYVAIKSKDKVVMQKVIKN